jgi:hypothetical protein
MLAVLAAFFCLLFFAAAKKSRCRPAQGRRLKHEGITRMPAKAQANQTARATKANRECQQKNNKGDYKVPVHQQPAASQTSQFATVIGASTLA